LRLSRRRLAAACTGALGLLAPLSSEAGQSFAAWLEGLRKEALAAGVRRATLDRALAGLEPIPRVIELDQRQPESRLSFREYRERVLSLGRIERGRDLAREHASLLARVRERYGVPPRVIVALWGVESSYGEFKGRFSVVGSLATLAHEGRRASLFRRELISALRILDAGDVAPADMYGSWAGAMGQSQFMPSTYLSYAVDFDGDGRRDIWRSLPDVFASIANYLARSGWQPGYVWGREVLAPRRVEPHRLGLEHKAPLAEWHALGVRPLDQSSLPPVAIKASLLAMDEGAGPSFLVYDNFRVFMVWNRSTYFALSVGLLSDAIGEV
jgi:membrane-bound lytic murein transglycosylase B